jgi:Fe2+-dicitrate sensor, membrane component
MDKNDQAFWELVAAKLNDELSPEEIARLEKELEDPERQRILEKGDHIHSNLEDVRELLNSDKVDSWETIEKAVNRARVYRFAVAFAKYAAILLIAFLSGLYVHSLFSPKDNGIQYAEMEVMYGQTGHLFLFDGTEVWLNSGTKLKYPNKFNQNERDVFVEGEAFFKVKPNKKLPFKVKTGKLEQKLLST